MNFIHLHDQDGLSVLVNLSSVESFLELSDGSCAIFFIGNNTKKKRFAFFPKETYKDVLRKLDYAVELPASSFSRVGKTYDFFD